MKITPEEVGRVAILARLELEDGEEKQLAAQIDGILLYIDKLNELDTSEVEPFTNPLAAVNAFREDKVTNQPRAEALLANAPETEGTFFRVPKIIE